MAQGLHIPKDLLILASGLDKKVVDGDLRSRKLVVTPGKDEIWYHDALVYVFDKWNEGKDKMYPPYSEEPEQSFAARVLSHLDDQIAVENLEMTWKRKFR